MIVDMVPEVREALGVSRSYDAVTIPGGIRRAITFMLRTWNFPLALTKVNVPIAEGDKELALPATGVGKIRAVRLVDDTQTLFKTLRRTLLGELPREDGPVFYWQEGTTLKLDTAVNEVGYSADIWYNSTDVDTAEPWITTDFEDVLFTLSTTRLARELRKPEVLATFAAIWQEDAQSLAIYLNEVEFNDLAVTMQPEAKLSVDRYGS